MSNRRMRVLGAALIALVALSFVAAPVFAGGGYDGWSIKLFAPKTLTVGKVGHASAVVLGADGSPAPAGVELNFSATNGSIVMATIKTSDGGVAKAEVTAGSSTAEPMVLRVELKDQPEIFTEVEIKLLPGDLDHVTVTGPSTVPADGQAELSVCLRDANSNPVDEQMEATVSVDSEEMGTVEPSTLQVTGCGEVTFTPAGPAGDVEVKAEAGGKTAEATITVTHGAMVALRVAVNNADKKVSIDETASITIQAVDAFGNLFNPEEEGHYLRRLYLPGNVLSAQETLNDSFHGGADISLNVRQKVGPARIFACWEGLCADDDFTIVAGKLVGGLSITGPAEVAENSAATIVVEGEDKGGNLAAGTARVTWTGAGTGGSDSYLPFGASVIINTRLPGEIIVEAEAEGLTTTLEIKVVEAGAPAAGGAYTVQRGDTLWSIFTDRGGEAGTGMGWEEWKNTTAQASGLTDPNLISVGQGLTLPAGP